MWEETGIGDVPLGPCLWSRRAVNRSGETPRGSDERYFLVRCGDREITTAPQLRYEVGRWWGLADLRASGDIFFPEPLADLVAPVIAGVLPPKPILLPE